MKFNSKFYCVAAILDLLNMIVRDKKNVTMNAPVSLQDKNNY